MQTQKNPRHASWPLFLFLALALLLPTLPAAWFGWQHYRNVMDEAEDMAERSVVALQEHAADVLVTHALVLHRIAEMTEGMSLKRIGSSDRLQRLVDDLTARFEQVAVIGITDAAGRVLVTSIEAGKNSSVADREYFTVHKNGTAKGMFFSEAFMGRITGTDQFALSIARASASGAFDGIIFASVPVTYFTNFWKQFVPNEGYLVPMVREDGVVLTRYPKVNNPRRLDPAGPFISRIRQSPRGLYTAVSQVDGIERINAYRQVRNYPLYISFSVEKSIMTRKWRDDMTPGFLMTVLVMIALACLWLVVVRQSRRQHMATIQWRNIANDLETEIRRRKEAEDALRQGQKLEALGQLASGIAHDFNNLLAGVVGNLQLMRVHLDQGRLDAVSRSINAAESVAETATGITQRLIAFSRREPLTPSVTGINDRIIVMRELITRTAGPSIAVHFTLADELWETLCDPNQLDTALLNLAINAKDAMADGGELGIVTQNMAVDDEAPDREVPPGEYAVLRVIDTGIGMTPELMERVFEPFFTTKPAGRGTGLGLAMIYSFVNESHGHIRLHSTPNIGTTVAIYLPRLKK